MDLRGGQQWMSCEYSEYPSEKYFQSSQQELLLEYDGDGEGDRWVRDCWDFRDLEDFRDFWDFRDLEGLEEKFSDPDNDDDEAVYCETEESSASYREGGL